MTIKRLFKPWLVSLALASSCAPAWSAIPDSGPAASAPAASASVPVAAAAWRVERDQAISQALAAWAARAGWVLQWEPRADWLAPQATVFRGDFVTAARALVEVLAKEGADIRATFYQGNKTLVIRAGESHE